MKNLKGKIFKGPRVGRGRVLRALFMVVFHSLLPMLFLIVYMSLGQRESMIQSATLDVDRAVKTASFMEENEIARSEQLLIALSQHPKVQNRDADECNQLLAVILSKFPSYNNIGAADLEGNVYCSAILQEEPVNQVDRIFFQGAIESRGFSVGDYVIGKITGMPTLYEGYPIIDSEGNLKGVVYLAMGLEWLNKEMSYQSFPPGSEVGLMDRNGTILALEPGNDSIGKSALSSEVGEAIVSDKERPFKARGTDGVERIYSFSQLHPTAGGGKVFLFMGIPKSFITMQANFILRRNLVMAGVIAATVFVIALVDWRLFIAGQISDNSSEKL